MRFKDLGKAHRVRVFQFDWSVSSIVASVAGWLIGTLIFIWFRSFSYWLTVSMTIVGLISLGKVSQVPFCREMIWTRLKGRVSFDP